MRKSLFVALIALVVSSCALLANLQKGGGSDPGGNNSAGDTLSEGQKRLLTKIEKSLDSIMSQNGDFDNVRTCENKPDYLSDVSKGTKGCDCSSAGYCAEKSLAKALEELKELASGTYSGTVRELRTDYEQQRKYGVPCKLGSGEGSRQIITCKAELPVSAVKRLVDSAVHKKLSESSEKQKGLTLPFLFQSLLLRTNGGGKISLSLPFDVGSRSSLTPVPITLAQVRETLSFNSAAQEREVAHLMRIYEAAGVPMEIDATLWEPYAQKCETAQSNLANLKLDSLPKRGPQSGKYGIALAKKRLKKVYRRAKIRKAYMAGRGWDIKTNRFGVQLSRKTWGVVVYSLPGEKKCRKIQFSVYEKANGRKFRRATFVGIGPEYFSKCR